MPPGSRGLSYLLGANARDHSPRTILIKAERWRRRDRWRLSLRKRLPGVDRIPLDGPIFVLGFSKEVIDTYILIVGFQAVFNHANVSVRLGPLRYVIVTPNFHHWHHSADAEGIDRNYAAHFAFIDYAFGTAHKADRTWPNGYGVVGDYVPNGFFKQLAFPFVWKG